MDMVRVTASEEEVRQALRSALSVEDFSQLGIAAEKEAPDVLSPEPRRAEPLSTTVGVWIVSGIVGGAAYDLTRKVVQLLIARFGAKNVVQDARTEAGGQ
jgi:hypothetical protein